MTHEQKNLIESYVCELNKSGDEIRFLTITEEDAGDYTMYILQYRYVIDDMEIQDKLVEVHNLIGFLDSLELAVIIEVAENHLLKEANGKPCINIF